MEQRVVNPTAQQADAVVLKSAPAGAGITDKIGSVFPLQDARSAFATRVVNNTKAIGFTLDSTSIDSFLAQ
jgi:hypothetical protein